MDEKIKILLRKRNIIMSNNVNEMETMYQNLSNKWSRENFTEKEMKTMLNALGYRLGINLTLDEIGEQL